MSYEEFLAGKKISVADRGFSIKPAALSKHHYPFQRHVAGWALRKGCAALFADCGLGKSLMELDWSQHVSWHTGKPTLILTPLADLDEMVIEAQDSRIRPVDSRWDVRRIMATFEAMRTESEALRAELRKADDYRANASAAHAAQLLRMEAVVDRLKAFAEGIEGYEAGGLVCESCEADVPLSEADLPNNEKHHYSHCLYVVAQKALGKE